MASLTNSTTTWRNVSHNELHGKCFKTKQASSSSTSNIAGSLASNCSTTNNHNEAPQLTLQQSSTIGRLLVLATIVTLLQNATPCSSSRGTLRHNTVGSSIIPSSSFMIPFQNAHPSDFASIGQPIGGLETNSFNTFQPGELAPGAWNPMATDVRAILDAHLSKILVPRVSGTPGNVLVRQYIMEQLHSYGYHVEQDKFVDSTPIGNVEFANVMGYSNKQACRQLVLACHYDSKMQEGFLGATDSAVPCAMLLKMAATFRDSFSADTSTGGPNPSKPGLLFIFFDGEEAFDTWTATDSLYGSRHLAAKWEKQAAPSHCSSQKNELARIELFVLLDLIGTSDTKFVMYNRKLSAHYNALQRHEKAYLTSSMRLSNDQVRQHTAFKSTHIPLHLIEDDHVPFKKRGVPILSLLAHPFPTVWHTNDDNYESIDFERTARILHVLEQFVSNYQGL